MIFFVLNKEHNSCLVPNKDVAIIKVCMVEAI